MNASLPEGHQLKGVQIWKDRQGREEQKKKQHPFFFDFRFVLGRFTAEFCDLFFCYFAFLRCGARSLSRSLVWPQSALCETSGIEE